MPHRNLFVFVVVAVTVLPVIYLLSYAPVHRATLEWSSYSRYSLVPVIDSVDGALICLDPPTTADQLLAFYAPAERVIDHTILQEPLLWWAGVWGVRQQQSFESFGRSVLEEMPRSDLGQ